MSTTLTGFRRANEPVKPRLIMSIKALEKQGKTHFSFTAPGPIAYLPFDIGDEGVREKFQGDKEILVPCDPKNPARTAPYIIPRGDQAGAQKELQRFERDYGNALTGTRTTVVDTGSELWELVRLADLGKLTQVMPHRYVETNAIYRNLIREAFEHDSNLILLHKMKAEWINGADGKGNKTGKFERAGFSDTGFLVQINAWAYREDRDAETGMYPGGPEDLGFRLLIEDCRQNPSLAGVILGQDGLPCDFPTLAMMVYPDSDPGDWL